MNIYDVRSLGVPEDWEALWFVPRRVRRYWACVSIYNQLTFYTFGLGVAFPLLAAGGAGPQIDPAYPRRVYTSAACH